MFKKSLNFSVIVCFLLTTLSPLPEAHADSVLGLPTPGTMINLSPTYQPVIIRGLTVHKDNPFLFDFIVDVGQDRVTGEPLKKESEKLIKYFMASLAIPDKDFWVNLSPYEKDKIIPEALSQTDMGRDLLEQDYILKQMTASLIYPEKQLGKIFWDRVYAKAQSEYGTTEIPVNTFNKVWIMADKASVYEHGQTVFVVEQHLKVMLEEDYLALKKHDGIQSKSISVNNTHSIGSQIVREIVLPELEKEINTGKNFANLRQIFNSIILSSWYKNNLKQSLLNQFYADKSKVNGIDLNDPTVKEQIYQQYLKAYKKGVFNFIKEDINRWGQTYPRKYFSGGVLRGVASVPIKATRAAFREAESRWNPLEDEQTGFNAATIAGTDAAMNSFKTINVNNVETLVGQVAALPSDKRVVMIVNTPFTTSNETAINFLNSGRQNIITLKGPQGVFGEFYFDGHPKSVGLSREILEAAGIEVPANGILDPSAWENRDELKSKILSLRDKIGLPLDAIEKLEHRKFATLQDSKKVKISDDPSFIFGKGDTVYANMHILDLRVRDKFGVEHIVRTYQNSPVITNEVTILGVGPETIKVWGKIVQDAKAVILVGDAHGFSDVLQGLPAGQIRLHISGSDTKAINQLESPVIWKQPEGLPQLSAEELALLREEDEQKGFISKRVRDDQRITHQVVQIEESLGTSQAEAETKASQIIADLNVGAVKFKGEEVHILNGTGTEAKVIGRIDRGIAEKYGYIHETANVVLIAPDGKVLLQLRNTSKYDDHLSMWGGHLAVGQSHFSGILDEMRQETRLSILQTLPVFVGFESYNRPNDSNRERRSWWVVKLTSEEYEEMKAKEALEFTHLGVDRHALTREQYKERLFQIYRERNDGTFEVAGMYGFSFEQLTHASTTLNPDSPYAEKTNRYLPVSDDFRDGEVTINAFFTPDSLNELLSTANAELLQSIKGVADAAMVGDVDKAAVATLMGSHTDNFIRGGIDLNTSNGMLWKDRKDGNGVEMDMNPAMLARIEKYGIGNLRPQIFKVTPIVNVWPLVGLQAPVKNQLSGVSINN